MEQPPGSSGNSDSPAPDRKDAPLFRSAIPACAAPDRADWSKKHGLPPYELRDVPAKFLTRAAAAAARDAATIGFNPAVNAHSALDEICEAVLWHCHHEGQLSEETHVFYDPNTHSFWAYPEPS